MGQLSRRRWLSASSKLAAGAALAGVGISQSACSKGGPMGTGTAGPASDSSALAQRLADAMAAPVLRREMFPDPVPVERLELIKAGSHYLVRAQGGGLTGYSDAHSSVMNSAWPILVNRVLPHFVGKDARDLEDSFRGAYVAMSNYKWQGLPFWVSMAAAEIAILDLLGKASGKSLGAMLGTVHTNQVGVYRASGNRGNTPEAEIAYLERLVEETGAKAIKFRLGARMRYDEASTTRDETLIPLTRKTFGDDMTIYADANGSYDVPMAIRIGRLMEEQKFRFYEEPLPYDHYEETKEVADALDIPIALGEQEASLRSFRSIIEHGVARVVQPDLMYFGGLIRSVKVARMAEIAGLECTPHMSGGGLGYLYVAHFASCVPNAGPHQEYKGTEGTLPVHSDTSSLESVDGMLQVPTGPGLGVEFDAAFLRSATVIRS
jgi:L-alanine-DL-glutamate epimerase-like enolase superfamily enzyme